MIKYYSKTDLKKELPLHIVFSPTYYKKEDILSDVLRENISDEREYLQSAHIYIPREGHRFRPHIHNLLTRQTHITQEAWVVISGIIKVTFYDLDGSVMGEEILHSNFMSITFGGGHTYEAMTDDVHVLEFKTGPYFGQEKDKEFIDEEK